MLINDIIKIKYSNEGYLPNYPPHLISDEEMCNAFLYNEYSYFYDTYKLVNNSLTYEYEELINSIKFHICRFLSSYEPWRKDLPDWVYSYMLGEVVNQSRDQRDRHYLLVGLLSDNIDDELDSKSQYQCYQMSKKYVNKLSKQDKFLNLDSELAQYDKSAQDIINSELNDKYKITRDSNNVVNLRPPTMFGEPHVIKLIRLNEVN